MNLCKVCFIILSFVASYVVSDFEIYKGKKLYFNSCQCGEAVALGYGLFSLNTKYVLNIHKKIVYSISNYLGTIFCNQFAIYFIRIRNIWH